jgi:transcriptional regulator with XRE-family HTH domain
MAGYDRKALRRFRIRRRLTVVQVARLARRSIRGIRAIESGAIPRADTLWLLARALRVPLVAFFRARNSHR